MMRPLVMAMALAMALLVAAWPADAGAQDSPAPGKLGYVHVTITGDFKATYHGTALLATADAGVALSFVNDQHAANDGVTIMRSAGGIPKPGTYAFAKTCELDATNPADTQFQAGFTWEPSNGADIGGSACDGTLTITAASRDIVKGQFKFTTSANQNHDDGTVKQFKLAVSGEFIAATGLAMIRR